MKTLIALIIVVLIAAAPCFAQNQNRQFNVTKQGNVTTVYDLQRGNTYQFYDTNQLNTGQLLPPPPKSSGPSVADILKVPPEKRWMYED